MLLGHFVTKKLDFCIAIAPVQIWPEQQWNMQSDSKGFHNFAMDKILTSI